MNTTQHYKKLTYRQFVLAAITMLGLMVVASGCNLPGEDGAVSDEQVISEETADASLPMYRMYFNSSEDADENMLEIRQFTGLLLMTDYEAIFGDVDDLPLNDNGNHVGGPKLADGLIWSLVANPSGTNVNLKSFDIDGTVSSVFDLDGDGIVDIADISVGGNGRRFTFVTEGLGMGVFEQWLCETKFAQATDQEGGKCDSSEGGEGEGGAPGGAIGGTDGGLIDPFDAMCSEYSTDGPPRVISQGGTYGYQVKRTTSITYGDGTSGGASSTTSVITFTDDNIPTLITTRTHYFNAADKLVQMTFEVVIVSPEIATNEVAHGSGSRVVTTWARDGSRIEAPSEPFDATVHEDGHYDKNETNPPPALPPEDAAEAPEGTDTNIPPLRSGESNPGPEGDDSRVAEFCESRSQESALDEVAGTDHAAFKISCGDLVGETSGNDDCVVFEWARPGNFAGALEPSEDSCGEFEKRDVNGVCRGTSIEVRLRGLAARIAAANLEGVDVCGDDLACDPPDVIVAFDNIVQTAGSETVLFGGSIPNVTLCFWGPGADWGTVSSLKADLQVKIVGVGAEEGWLIVDHPDFEAVSCWVDEDDVVASTDLDLSSLPVFDTPALVNGDADDGDSGDSGSSGSTDPSAPAAPSGISATTICAGTTYNVILNWSDNSNNESGFWIYRDGNLLATVGPNTTQFTDTNPTDALGHTYSVRAYNGSGDSSPVQVSSKGCLL